MNLRADEVLVRIVATRLRKSTARWLTTTAARP